MSDILFETLPAQHGEIAVITLNRLKALNALTHEMILAFYEQLTTWASNDAITAVIVKSNSEKAFCAGGDIVDLYHRGAQKASESICFFKDEYQLNQAIYDFKKPYIALLDGITMGGGVGISLHGNCAIATENFSFAMPETGIGFFPDVGGSRLLSKSPDHIGVYLGLTGKRIGVRDALFAGLVTQTIQRKHQQDFIERLLQADLREHALDVVKELRASFTVSQEKSSLELHASDIRKVFQFDSVEAIVDALEHLDNEWSNKTLKILRSKSPTSLKVTLAQIRQAEGLSMNECMDMEYRMVNCFLRGKDFYEGVRALLIDKDKTPKWDPSELSTVSNESVDRYFTLLSD